ncbi:MAG: YgiQ family radical SAM protein [Oscillospiraceae bacterium]|nr:YgiQ family radical SAM protein [Oscillospiraceae bacterium]
MMNKFLPITRAEMTERGWASVDFVFITGDSYVDHPSFGVAILTRLLESRGYTVAVLAQPDWKDPAYPDFKQFGCPNLGFFVTSGNIDSMVAHYTAAKKKRSDDAYTAGGKAGNRPDHAVAVYCNILRKCYPNAPIIIGGLEASLRRFAHYDYWSDSVLPSILFDSKADLLVYGMGENQILHIAEHLKNGENIATLQDVKGTAYAVKTTDYQPASAVDLPSYNRVATDKRDYAIAARKQYEEADAVCGRTVIQRHDMPYGNYILVQNPPAPPLTTQQLDEVYSLPYNRYYHPSYEALGGVPAIAEVEFSITHNRGCFGACNFCSLAFHQGRAVTVRSKQSIIQEAMSITQNPRFKGYIHDIGGPTANFRLPSCKKQEKLGLCKNRKCLAPKPCEHLQVEHTEYLDILRQVRKLPKIKKVFIRSGIRFDYLIKDESNEFFNELVQNHISGQLKVAPEHCSAAVLDKMGKPHIEVYKRFQDEFYKITKHKDKEQYLVPYLMSSHPGATLNDAVELALFLKKEKIRPEQVQDYYPTPGTISTAMFYTGLDPYTLEEIYVAKTPAQKAMQRALLQYFVPKNRPQVVAALKAANRADAAAILLPGVQINTPPERTKTKNGSGKHKNNSTKNNGRSNKNNGKKSQNSKRNSKKSY